jgi:hypothetical protein
MLSNKLILLFITIWVFLFFTTCKKYPKNKLWFTNPDKLTPFNGHITKYMINGRDSLDAFNKYINRNTGVVKNIQDFEFTEDHLYSSSNTSHIVIDPNNGSQVLDLEYSFSKKYKYMEIYCNKGKSSLNPPNDGSLLSKDIFIERGLSWEIIHLSEKGPLKIKTIYNGNTYEIEISK